MKIRKFDNYGFSFFANLRTAEEAYLLYREGQLDEEYWRTRGAIAVNNLSNPAIRNQFGLAVEHGLFTSEFANWLSTAATDAYGE